MGMSVDPDSAHICVSLPCVSRRLLLSVACRWQPWRMTSNLSLELLMATFLQRKRRAPLLHPLSYLGFLNFQYLISHLGLHRLKWPGLDTLRGAGWFMDRLMETRPEFHFNHCSAQYHSAGLYTLVAIGSHGN